MQVDFTPLIAEIRLGVSLALILLLLIGIGLEVVLYDIRDELRKANREGK